jgi:cell wall assembly regulator SMI1
MRNLAELNINEGGKVVGRAPPTPEVISAFEHEFNVSLPSEYLELLMYSNGGHPELDSIAPMGRTDIAEWAINHFLYLNEDRNGPESLWRAAKEWRPILGEKQIPFAADGGGDPFVLDLVATPARVVGSLIDEGFALVEIAASFSDFIDRLEFNPDYI